MNKPNLEMKCSEDWENVYESHIDFLIKLQQDIVATVEDIAQCKHCDECCIEKCNSPWMWKHLARERKEFEKLINN